MDGYFSFPVGPLDEEAHMPSAASTTLEIQTDHRHWLRELDAWESCLALCQSEQALLVNELERLQQVIQNHGSVMEKHARAIQSERQQIAASERELPGCEARPVGHPVADAHARIDAQHVEQRSLHERIKRIHHSLMTQLAMYKDRPSYE
jgi:hypothetical protein